VTHIKQQTAKINFITSWTEDIRRSSYYIVSPAEDIIRTAYYILGPVSP